LKLFMICMRLTCERNGFLVDGNEKTKRGNWLRLLCSGDEQAFARFVDEYQQIVFLCCRTLGLNETEAEDVASETFLAVYQKLSTYRGQSKLSTWLWKIAYYKGIDYMRKNNKHKQLQGEIDEQLADDKIAGVHIELQNQEQSEIVWRAVQHLPRLWGLAIILFYREDKSIDEISKILKKRKGTVKTYLFRGRKKLKELLGDFLGDRPCQPIN